MATKPFRIGLIGFGNIGAGVVRTLDQNRSLLDARLPRPLELAAIADLDVTTKRDCPYDPAILTNDAKAVIDDPAIDCVLELIGGEEPARTLVERALKAGKHVVTANKALLALHGPELAAIAREHGVGLLFEAAVAGGIPIIRALQQGLAANELTRIQGILNGTCNYILTQMTQRGIDFATALGEAKEQGYAEPDPTYDIEGYDTAHKTAILASLAFGMDIRFKDVYVEGITGIKPVDIRHATDMGYAIKLLGIARRESPDAPAEVRVHPTLVPADAPIGQVHGVYNAVFCEGKPVGATMFHGRGAGADATSSAVISDLMALASDTAGFNAWRDARLAIPVGKKNLKSIDDVEGHFYVRALVRDQPGVMAMIGQAMANHDVSIESMVQYNTIDGVKVDKPEGTVIVSIVTHQASNRSVQAAMREIEAHAKNVGSVFMLRVEE